VSVRDELREATGPLHLLLEGQIRAGGYLDDLDRYAVLLQRFHACHAPLERRLERLAWGAVLPDAPMRLIKTAWLEQDLRQLGRSPARDADQLPGPDPTKVEEALGCLYVLEGATLGGAVVSRVVATRLGLTEHHGARFFHGYGESRGLLWRRYVSLLERHALDLEARRAMVRAASATFATFAAAMRGDPRS
jgi:heme oxygenase (biliverdin-IX-beta and delta-forming)